MMTMRRITIFWIALILLSGCTRENSKEDSQNTTKIEMKNEIAEKNKNSALSFFKALEDENVDRLVALFAEEAIHINPYSSGLFPEGARGKDGIRAYWTPVFPNFDGMDFPIEEIQAMEDPNMVFVKFNGRIKLKGDAGFYENDYYSTFRFNKEGLITEYVEIFNPIVAARGFGLIDKIK